MRKFFFYNFLPTKPEEETYTARGVRHTVTRTLTEIRDVDLEPEIDPNDPWQIKKSVTTAEIKHGTLTLSQEQAFNHIFRYWPLEICDNVVTRGNMFRVVITDHTNKGEPKRYDGPNIFLEPWPNKTYVLGWMVAVEDLLVNPMDEIGLY